MDLELVKELLEYENILFTELQGSNVIMEVPVLCQ